MHSLLEVKNLTTVFKTDEGDLRAVDDVSLMVPQGKIVGLVGESGSGKSVTALSILRLVEPPGQIVGGQILFQNQDLLKFSEKEIRQVRGRKIAMIFQEPMTSLNPVLTIGTQMAEVTPKEKIHEWLDRVKIADPKRIAKSYPHELSGGMRQRVMIAMALSTKPDLLIADEPTTALDVTIQAQIMKLLEELHRDFGMSLLFITHDMGLIAETVDEVFVMKSGKIVEHAPVFQLFEHPEHPYTQTLLRAVQSQSFTPRISS